MSSAPVWYSVTVEVDGRPVDPPCTLASTDVGGDLADRLVRDYGLEELGRPWRIRVYAGYNSYDDLLLELSQP